MNFLKAGKDIDFMGLRKYFLTASLFLFTASLIGFFKPVPRYGTDFVGGTEVEVAFKKTVTAKQLRKTVASLGFASPDVVSVANDKNPNHYLIRVKEVTSLDEKQRTYDHTMSMIMGCSDAYSHLPLLKPKGNANDSEERTENLTFDLGKKSPFSQK